MPNKTRNVRLDKKTHVERKNEYDRFKNQYAILTYVGEFIRGYLYQGKGTVKTKRGNPDKIILRLAWSGGPGL